MVQFINWSSGEMHPWGAGAQLSVSGELKSGFCPVLAWGRELCPQPEQRLVPSAQEGARRWWER